MNRAIWIPLVVGVLGAILFFIQVAIDPTRALIVYIGAFAFGVTTAVASLLFVMINHTARSTWYVPFRRLNEAAAMTLPLFAALFIPIALTLHTAFPWAHPEQFDDQVQAVYAHARAWYNPGFFIVRAYVYLAIWIFVALVLRHNSVSQDADGRVSRTKRQRWVSSASTPVLAITLTLAAFDWFMSLIPAWTSTMHGLYIFAGGFSGAIALTCIVAWLARNSHLLPEAFGVPHFLAIGRVLLLSTILWGYISFCALLLVWIANLPHEVLFYKQRVHGGWAVVAVILIFGHFVLPFLVLLSREIKRHPASLAAVGAWILLMHAVDAYWLTVPSMADGPSVLDVGAFLAIFGFAFAFGASRFFAVRPIPIRDPNLARSLRYETF